MVDVLAFGIDHLRFVNNSIHQAEGLSLISGEATSCKHQFLGRCVANLADHKRRDGGRRETQTYLGEGELRFLFGNHDVGSSNDAVGTTDTSAMHIDDDSLVAKINRLKQLEDITNGFKGVEKSYAIQAGREVRIMVIPDQVNDSEMVLLARDIAKEIEAQLEYPGQIKVSVIRESRAIDYAK